MFHGRLLLSLPNQPFPVAYKEPSQCSGSAVSRVCSRLPWGEDPDPKLLFAHCRVTECQPETLQSCWRTEIFPLCYQLGKARGGQSRSLLYLEKLSDPEQVVIPLLEVSVALRVL